jgi:fructosamine-3-kinase
MCCKSQPVLIDPAVYFGHPSVDLAMTTLFGGFEKNFTRPIIIISPYLQIMKSNGGPAIFIHYLFI